MIRTTVYLRTDGNPDVAELVSEGLNTGLGFIVAHYSRAKDGSGPEVLKATVEPVREESLADTTAVLHEEGKPLSDNSPDLGQGWLNKVRSTAHHPV
jgi:hypothetical protein